MAGYSQEGDLVVEAARRAASYLSNVRNRPVAPTPQAIADLDRLAGPLPAGPTDPLEAVSLLDEFGSPATVATSGGRFFGFVIGGSLPAARAASILAAAWDQNAALRVMSPVAAFLEDVTLGWLLDVLGLPASSGGGFVTGATMASFTCLAAARHHLLAEAGWDVEEDGLFGAPPITVVVNEESHVSVLKALALLGLGRKRVLTVPADEQGRMRARELPKLTGPSIICMQAGNVNTGAFDPASDICRFARDHGAWVHVDGAFGLWAAAAPARSHLVEGVAEADSWATDAHKWLNVPYDSGLAFVRNAGALRAAMSFNAAYLAPGADREPMYWIPDASRRARGVEIWAAMRSLGRSGLADLIERTCGYAEGFAAGLGEAGYSVLNDVVLNQVLVSFGPPDLTTAVIRALQVEGTCWCGGTVWKGQTAMRISVSSWATTAEDVEKSLASMIRVAREEEKKCRNS